MRKETTKAAVILLLCVISLPAVSWADWQYTAWGMTSDEVRIASRDVASAPERDPGNLAGCKTLLTAPYKTAKFSFLVEFCFINERLVLVALELDSNALDTDRLLLETELEERYGKPEEDETVGVGGVEALRNRRWRDASSGNLVYFVTSGLGKGMARLTYKPIPAADDGL